MKLFLDTNIFVASLTDEPSRGDAATDVMNLDTDLYTSVLNLMELRTVLAKKKQVEQKVVEEIIDDIEDRSTISYPDQLTSRQANDIQKDTLLYPLDSLIHTLAAQRDCVLVTFDSELIDHGAHSPEDVLEMF